MLSVVAGNTVGVAKRATIVLVRLPRRRSNGALPFTKEQWLTALNAVAQDLSSQGTSVSAIIHMPVGVPQQEFIRRSPGGEWVRDPLNPDQYLYDESAEFGWTANVKLLLNNIVANGGFLVTGSGNTGWQPAIYPAKFCRADESSPITSMLVVGAVANNGNNDGARLPYDVNPDQNGYPHVYAPGVDVRVANGQPYDIRAGNSYRQGKGTSEGETAFWCGMKLC